MESIRLKGNQHLLTGDTKMPPIDRNEYLDYAFGKNGQNSSYINLLFCVWFFVGMVCASLDVTFYGFSKDELLISFAGLSLSSLSIYVTLFGKGSGFFKGLSDILTGAIVLYVSTKVDIIAYQCLLLLLGGILTASGLYLGTSRDADFIRQPIE